ncbi:MULTISPECIES: ABC transporter permease [unclassified Diaminobutyricimonas]|uniref:ABC transporter permease n=1 Tax=unclassified Diaminobutyricimonas TaxID=2643261 RepID=UPI0012F4B313|nr:MULTISPECIES: ABC transporter permease [unclassified Diaminobutyricimonas]
MKRRRLEGARKALTFLGLPVLLVGLWWFASAGSQNFFWPPLRTIVEVFPETWLEGRILADVLPSLGRLAVGYLLALVVGVVLGVVIGVFRTIRRVLEPVLEFFRALPPPALIPVIMLFAGIGDEMKVVVIVTGCVWPILLNTIEGVRGLDDVLLDTAQVYRLRSSTRVRHLILRGASPRIVAGARQALSVGIILMVISEMFAASNGIGFSIVQFQRGFAIPQMWSGIILLGVCGVLLALVFRLVEARVLTWYTGMRRLQRKG